MKEIIQYFADNGFYYNSMKRKNRHLKPGQIKAGMKTIYEKRDKYRPDQLARAALRAAEQISKEEGLEEELKLQISSRELEKERALTKQLKRRIFWLIVSQAWFVSVGLAILFSYLGWVK